MKASHHLHPRFSRHWLTGLLLVSAVTQSASAGPRSSASYTIGTDTLDSGGRPATSAAYANVGSIGNVAGVSSVGTINLESGYIAQLAESAAGSFEAWQMANFSVAERADPNISGPNADPDHDGLDNLLEYALGLAPKSPGTAGQPVIGSNSTYWLFTYNRPAGLTDVSYSVQVYTTLTAWTTTGLTHEQIAENNGIQTWQAKYLLNSAPKLFFRLKVLRP